MSGFVPKKFDYSVSSKFIDSDNLVIVCATEKIYDVLCTVGKPSEFRRQLSDLSFDEYTEISDIIAETSDNIILQRIIKDAYDYYFNPDAPFKITFNGLRNDSFEEKTSLIFVDGIRGSCNMIVKRTDKHNKYSTTITELPREVQKPAVSTSNISVETAKPKKIIRYVDKKYKFDMHFGKYDKITRLELNNTTVYDMIIEYL